MTKYGNLLSKWRSVKQQRITLRKREKVLKEKLMKIKHRRELKKAVVPPGTCCVERLMQNCGDAWECTGSPPRHREANSSDLQCDGEDCFYDMEYQRIGELKYCLCFSSLDGALKVYLCDECYENGGRDQESEQYGRRNIGNNTLPFKHKFFKGFVCDICEWRHE